jgi:hypothetical protein
VPLILGALKAGVGRVGNDIITVSPRMRRHTWPVKNKRTPPFHCLLILRVGCSQFASSSVVQYVRCTHQKPLDEIGACTVNNTPKFAWIPQKQGYTGASGCPTANNVLLLFGLALIPLVVVALARYLVPLTWARCRRLGTYNYPRLRLEAEHTLRATQVLEAALKQTLTAYLTAAAFQRKDIQEFTTLANTFVLFLARPRATPLIGALGLFKPWSQQGLAELLVDFTLTCIAGTMIGLEFGPLVTTRRPDLAAPDWEFMVLGGGAILLVAPAAILLLVGLAIILFCDTDKTEKRSSTSRFFHGFFAWALYVAGFGVMLGLSPILALLEIAAAIAVTIRSNKTDQGFGTAAFRMKELLCRCDLVPPFVYRLFLVSSWATCTGCWIFWLYYLNLERELFCPSGMDTAQLIWFLAPLGVDLLFWAFRVLTNDHGR